jgi:hypothetical protein
MADIAEKTQKTCSGGFRAHPCCFSLCETCPQKFDKPCTITLRYLGKRVEWRNGM